MPVYLVGSGKDFIVSFKKINKLMNHIMLLTLHSKIIYISYYVEPAKVLKLNIIMAKHLHVLMLLQKSG